MKPDWKKAPHWAQYAAINYDNTWTWHEYRPRASKQTMSLSMWEGYLWVTARKDGVEGRTQKVKLPEVNKSLQKRPE